MSGPLRWVVAIEVDEDMVADGIDLSLPRTLEWALARGFPLARSSAFRVAIVEAPDAGDVRRAQGYDE